MEPQKILSTSWLDLLFDNRNKEYGAYELRKSYDRRVLKSLAITAVLIALFIATGFIKRTERNVQTIQADKGGYKLTDVFLPKEKKPIQKPAETSTASQEQVKEVIFSDPVIMPDEKRIIRPMASVDELAHALPSISANDGKGYSGQDLPISPAGNQTGVADGEKEKIPDEPLEIVQVPAKFSGNWVKFLLRNLDPEVPARNGAPAGRHTVIIKFIIDVDGNISNLKALTNAGFGMEAEAIRVIKKAEKWEPAIQNGIKVKAYRQQPITFEVLEE